MSPDILVVFSSLPDQDMERLPSTSTANQLSMDLPRYGGLPTLLLGKNPLGWIKETYARESGLQDTRPGPVRTAVGTVAVLVSIRHVRSIHLHFGDPASPPLGSLPVGEARAKYYSRLSEYLQFVDC